MLSSLSLIYNFLTINQRTVTRHIFWDVWTKKAVKGLVLSEDNIEDLVRSQQINYLI
jgi:hypothetical protein